MIRRFFLPLIAGLAVTAASKAQEQKPTAEAFMNTWRIVKVVGFADESGGPPLGRRILGKVLTITPDRMTINFDNWSCKPNSGFRTRDVNTALFLAQETGASPQDVTPPKPYPKLPAQATILDSDNCLAVLWLDRNHVEFDFDGVFVVAKRKNH